MKKLIIISLLLGMLGGVYALSTGRSSLYGDSYMLRAMGTDAVYWNPASLNADYADIILPGFNQSFCLSNNSLDVDTYNFISGNALDEHDKQVLLDKLKNNLRVEMSGHGSIFGMTMGNMAFSTALHFYSSAQLSKRYAELALYGNTDSVYVFSRKSTNVSGLAFQDVTLGAGGYNLPVFSIAGRDITVKVGGSVSGLIGYAAIKTKSYHGLLETGLNGMNLHQDIVLTSGFGGAGIKGLLGIKADIYDNLSLGITADNLFGNIKWMAKTQDNLISLRADSVYVADLDENIFTKTDTTYDAPDFHTVIPPVMRIAAMYALPWGSVSVDYAQSNRSSVFTSPIGNWAVAAELLPWKWAVLSWGLGIGNHDYPWRMSYGAGLRFKQFDTGFGMQSIQSGIPNNTSKGISFASYLTIPL